jgi:hypothetical protein
MSVIKSLGYITVAASDIDRWRQFAFGVLGINERHHSLAICPAMNQAKPGLVHVMVEVDSLDAVGETLDRVNAEDFQEIAADSYGGRQWVGEPPAAMRI